MRDPRLAPFRGPTLAFAAFLALVALSAAVLFALKLGATPDDVRAFYLGSEERYTSPRSAEGLLEVAVVHLLAMPLALFAAIHLVAFARLLPRRSVEVLKAFSFGSALLGIAAGFGVRFVAPELAWLKIVAFAGTEVSLLAWAALLVLLFRPAREPAGAPHMSHAR